MEVWKELAGEFWQRFLDGSMIPSEIRGEVLHAGGAHRHQLCDQRSCPARKPNRCRPSGSYGFSGAARRIDGRCRSNAGCDVISFTRTLPPGCTAAELDVEQIVALVDDLLDAQREWRPESLLHDLRTQASV
jgi:hypothetical protein